MLKEKVAKYYTPEYDLNCAEAILYGSNEYYQLNLSKETLKAIAGFGGGMAREEVCGAISAAVAVLGIMFVKERAHEDDTIKNLVSKLFDRFHEKMETSNCKSLKEAYRKDDETKCKFIIITAAEVLEEIINEASKNS